MLLFSVTLFIVGACMGSFLNVVIDRLPQERSIWRGRSVCDSCHKKLTPLELIPIVSYIALKGKCKNCHAKIPFRLTLVELLTGFSFAGVFITSQFSLLNFQLLLYSLIVLSISIAIFFIDLDYGIIPDELILLLAFVSSIYLFTFHLSILTSHLLSALGSGLIFVLLFLITRGRGMGLGDVKLAPVMGLILGFPNIIVGLYFAFLTGALISVGLIIYGKKKFKSTVPFGPFLASGMIFAYFFTEPTVHFILKLLNW